MVKYRIKTLVLLVIVFLFFGFRCQEQKSINENVISSVDVSSKNLTTTSTGVLQRKNLEKFKLIDYKNVGLGINFTYPDYFNLRNTTTSVSFFIGNDENPKIKISKYSKDYFIKILSVQRSDVESGYGEMVSTTVAGFSSKKFTIIYEGVTVYILVPEKNIVISIYDEEAMCNENYLADRCRELNNILNSLFFN